MAKKKMTILLKDNQLSKGQRDEIARETQKIKLNWKRTVSGILAIGASLDTDLLTSGLYAISLAMRQPPEISVKI